MRRATLACLTAIALGLAPARGRADDAFLGQLYRQLNDSPMQRKLRALKPFPVSVVYIEQRGQTNEDMRRTFRAIKQAGFDSLKQIFLLGGEEVTADRQAERQRRMEEAQMMALDEGLSPFYYGVGGWAPIDAPLLARLGIPADLPLAAIEDHPAMRAYQEQVFRQRVRDAHRLPPLPTYAKQGEPGRGNAFIPERLSPLFAQWLEQNYGTLVDLRQAWNVETVGGPALTSFSQAAASLVTGPDPHPLWDFRRYRDSLRFQADLAATDYDRLMKHHLAFDPWEPVRTGGHHVLDNQAFSGWDLTAQAHAAAQGGSFYSSVHLAHHFREVDGEIDRPVYMQARIIADSFKGGWAAVWESTGGPSQWSGSHSFAVDGGLLTRLMLSYIGAGLKGIGLWTWNSRDNGWEAGEYALTDLLGRPTDRVRAAGAIAQALQRHRFELWDAEGEPLVGVLASWENEAVFARLSLGAAASNRAATFQRYPAQARIGVARALINAHIPFEFVSDSDLRAGLAGRYRALYLPSVLGLPADLIDRLTAYVRAGGRLVADMPLLLYDDFGRKVNTAAGSAFATLFGFSLVDNRNSANAPQRLQGFRIEGQYADLEPAHAVVKSRFQQGGPAILQNTLGQGEALFINAELSRAALKPGHAAAERLLVRTVLGDKIHPAWTADKALVYRRSAPTADHYFLINDGEATTVRLQNTGGRYRTAADAVTGEAIALHGASLQVPVAAHSGRWVRAQRN